MGQYQSTKSTNGDDLSARIRALDITPPTILISRSPNTNRGIVPVSRHYGKNVVTGTVSLYKVTTSHLTKRRSTDDKSEIMTCYVTTHHPMEGHVNGYTFTSNPVKPGDSLVFKVIQGDPDHGHGGLGIGFTSCNPRSLRPNDLPQKDPNDLLDRPEYWVFDNLTATQGCGHGDEICIKFEMTGEIRMGQNGGPLRTLMHVDHSTPLWAFLSLSGSTIGIRLLGKISPPNCELRPEMIDRHEKGLGATRTRVASLTSSTPVNNSDPTRLVEANDQSHASASSRRLTKTIVSKNNEDDRGKIRRRRTRRERSRKDDDQPTTLSDHELSVQIETGQSSNNGQDLSRKVKAKNGSTKKGKGSQSQRKSGGKSVSDPPLQKRNPLTRTKSECIICCHKEINSVFLECGHMCLCIDCATAYWNRKSGQKQQEEQVLDDVPHCPMCRGAVTGFIQTFTS